jgi:hypothetical protein
MTMKFHELRQKRADLERQVQLQEVEIERRWSDILGGNNPLMIGLNLLASTFSKARCNPYVSVLQAVVYVYRDFKEDKLPDKDSFLEYFLALATRLTDLRGSHDNR